MRASPGVSWIAANRSARSGRAPVLVRRQVLAVRLHRLPQQRHLAHALRAQRGHLARDVVDRARALPPAAVGHDAVGAELIAAVDDRHERRRPLRLRERLRPELAAELRLRHQVPEDHLEALRPRPNVDVRKARAQVVGPRPDHAAHHGDLEAALAVALQLPQAPEVAGRPVLRLLPHDAGVHDREVGVIRPSRPPPSPGARARPPASPSRPRSSGSPRSKCDSA